VDQVPTGPSQIACVEAPGMLQQHLFAAHPDRLA
jgi:hypothetical protein